VGPAWRMGSSTPEDIPLAGGKRSSFVSAEGDA
jgi:hypothetical protein